jgi:hypothetical protein
MYYVYKYKGFKVYNTGTYPKYAAQHPVKYPSDKKIYIHEDTIDSIEKAIDKEIENKK